MDVADIPGVPAWLPDHLREQGIEELYPPQAAAVEAGVTRGQSTVAAVPTASGKTLVAELAMLSSVAGGTDADSGSGAAAADSESGTAGADSESGTAGADSESGTAGADSKGSGAGADSESGTAGEESEIDGASSRRAPSSDGIALYIVPLRALASEKQAEFEEYERYGLDVAVTTGNYESQEGWLADQDVVVATSEKVDSLVRNGANWIEDVDCVVADEVHLVDDGERGPTLEVTLAKLRRLNPDLQTVALSATIGNADEIADWLDAELVESDWRPIELRKGVHYGQALHLDDGSQQEVPVRSGQKQTAALVEDTVEDGGSSLVFVNSRRNAEAAARRLGNAVERHLTDDERRRLDDLAGEIRDVSDTETSDDLADAVETGAAFHHAGLAREHRSLVEEAFRDRLVKVIAATPTLAAGVNTPSRRVIVRDWQRYDGSAGGMQPLDVLEVHQMMGRAGRPGLDPYGEAVLVAASHDELDELFERYIWAEPEPVRSKLAAEPALRTHILATVASGFARTRQGLLEFLEGTLYAAQSTEEGRLEEVTDRVLEYLQRNDFLEREGDDLEATSLGHTVSRLYLDPMSAAEIVDGLRAARRAAATEAGDAEEPADVGFRTASEMLDGAGDAGAADDTGDAGGTDDERVQVDVSALGLYHLVSRTPDMYELYLRSGDRERYSEIAYERETELLGDAPTEYEEERWEDWLAALKTAKLLEDWADELDEDRITERYGVGPGDVRGKVDTASWLLGAAESLADELDLDVGGAVQRARMRVEHGVREELLELAGVRNVGRKRARRLHEAGIEDRADLRNADKSVVLAALRGREQTAETILENVGRKDPSMDDVTADREVEAAVGRDDGDREDSQTGLGEF